MSLINKKAINVLIFIFLFGTFQNAFAGESTYVYPQIFEQPGEVLDSINTHYNVINGFYNGSNTTSRQKGAPVKVMVELYEVDYSFYFSDQPVFNALPLENDNGAVISAIYSLDKNNRVLHLRIKDLITQQNNGVFVNDGLFIGTMIVTVTGEDQNFSFTANQINVLSGPSDLRVRTLERTKVN